MPKRTRNHKSALLEDLKDNSQLAASYLNAALEESPQIFLRAMRDVAEAHRMALVAEHTGLAREALYKTLSSEGNPRFSTFTAIIKSLGLKITVQPQETSWEPADVIDMREAITNTAISVNKQSISISHLYGISGPAATATGIAGQPDFNRTGLGVDVDTSRIAAEMTISRVGTSGVRSPLAEALVGASQNG